MVGQPLLTPDSSGFKIFVANDRAAEVTISWLEFLGAPDSAYMRNFYINGYPGIGFPMQPGPPTGVGRGDTVFFAPVTIAPDLSEMAELMFLDFYLDSRGVEPKANVSGKTFRFRFSDGSDIIVEP